MIFFILQLSCFAFLCGLLLAWNSYNDLLVLALLGFIIGRRLLSIVLFCVFNGLPLLTSGSILSRVLGVIICNIGVCNANKLV